MNPGWRKTFVRASTLKRLVTLQNNHADAHLDLGYITDACVTLGLDHGVETVLQRAARGWRERNKAFL